MAIFTKHITLEQAVNSAISKGLRFDCFTSVIVGEFTDRVHMEGFDTSYFGVSRGNGIWHWFRIDDTFSANVSGNQFEERYGLTYTHSYSQNTGATFKHNADYIKTAERIFN